MRPKKGSPPPPAVVGEKFAIAIGAILFYAAVIQIIAQGVFLVQE